MDSCYPLKVEKTIVLSMGAWVSSGSNVSLFVFVDIGLLSVGEVFGLT